MAIIFVDIKELENSKTANIIPTGNNDEEKAMQVVEYFEKGNDVILKGTIITEYEKIIEEIKNQFDYSDMSDMDIPNDRSPSESHFRESPPPIQDYLH